MAKLLKMVLVSVYAGFLVRYLQITLTDTRYSIELEYVFRKPGDSKRIHNEIKKYAYNLALRKMSLDFKKPERLPTDLKYILKWKDPFPMNHSPMFSKGQSMFLNSKCKFQNCYLTDDKSLLPDLRYYDAILFDTQNNFYSHPIIRAPHQYYIFTASEPAANYPICHPSHDSFYNLTWTYKLDSDILGSFITIHDKAGRRIGPKTNMKWVKSTEQIPNHVLNKIMHKNKAAAWFDSKCKSSSQREVIVKELNKALKKYFREVDIYGWCGQLTCPGEETKECLDVLETDYYFYLAFEDTLSDDYVTDKMLYPLLHHTVPIVYGGANYSRFLPPGSYLNAVELNATELAFRISEAIRTPNIYFSYFRWHHSYDYKESPNVADMCALCEKLNKPIKYSVVINFRQWWNPKYQRFCMRNQSLRFELE